MNKSNCEKVEEMPERHLVPFPCFIVSLECFSCEMEKKFFIGKKIIHTKKKIPVNV